MSKREFVIAALVALVVFAIALVGELIGEVEAGQPTPISNGGMWPRSVTSGVSMEITTDATFDSGFEFKPQTTNRTASWRVGNLVLINEDPANEVNIYCTGEKHFTNAIQGLTLIAARPLFRLYPKGQAGAARDISSQTINGLGACREFYFVSAGAGVVYVEARPDVTP